MYFFKGQFGKEAALCCLKKFVINSVLFWTAFQKQQSESCSLCSAMLL